MKLESYDAICTHSEEYYKQVNEWVTRMIGLDPSMKYEIAIYLMKIADDESKSC